MQVGKTLTLGIAPGTWFFTVTYCRYEAYDWNKTFFHNEKWNAYIWGDVLNSCCFFSRN